MMVHPDEIEATRTLARALIMPNPTENEQLVTMVHHPDLGFLAAVLDLLRHTRPTIDHLRAVVRASHETRQQPVLEYIRRSLRTYERIVDLYRMPIETQLEVLDTLYQLPIPDPPLDCGLWREHLRDFIKRFVSLARRLIDEHRKHVARSTRLRLDELRAEPIPNGLVRVSAVPVPEGADKTARAELVVEKGFRSVLGHFQSSFDFASPDSKISWTGFAANEHKDVCIRVRTTSVNGVLEEVWTCSLPPPREATPAFTIFAKLPLAREVVVRNVLTRARQKRGFHILAATPLLGVSPIISEFAQQGVGRVVPLDEILAERTPSSNQNLDVVTILKHLGAMETPKGRYRFVDPVFVHPAEQTTARLVRGGLSDVLMALRSVMTKLEGEPI